ncbi:unnamed protein product [Adineta steineri]|uniref:PARP catalytic domain-containing protein n=1 Tax=Adineta steineri TaxID=433720 RepID=A0A819L459_9BILA|nr:unnamed protein product [Adineta steineri]CAF1480537.1 unnamed protein product [Adineta steineri]CAF3613967.1 unnamed protein product [Adineta steineri]CAF3954567.1 unnamed protein product [Adineta steineri]
MASKSTANNNFKISIRIRSNGAVVHPTVHLKTTILDIIRDVCEQNGLNEPEQYYLAFNNDVLEYNETVEKLNLHTLASSTFAPELCTKTSYLLKPSPHIGKHIILTSLKKLLPTEVLNIHLPFKVEDFIPDYVKKIGEQIAFNKGLSQTNTTLALSHTKPNNITRLIPLPVFGHTIIDDLPYMKLTIPLDPDKFDWHILLKHLADDLEIDIDDLVILKATRGSTIVILALKRLPSTSKETLDKFTKKISTIYKEATSKVKEYVKKLVSASPKDYQDISGIHVELTNFDKIMNDEILIPDDIDLFYELNERPAIIDDHTWTLLKEKSRHITICISDAFKNCEQEYVINCIIQICNDELANDYRDYSSTLSDKKNERILFHGVKDRKHFDGIFEENFCFMGKTDIGWYGQGIYFTSSPNYAISYDKTGEKINYIICSIVSLGKTLHINNMNYKGKPLHPDYNSHYVQVDTEKKSNRPIKNNKDKYYEEFVIKDKKQILPLYIIGLRESDRFVIWRDAKIANQENTNTYKKLKETYNFNIYGSETSDDALKLLKHKLFNKSTLCVVVTNGADDGKGFAIECRKERLEILIIVYCMNVAYHQKWVDELVGEPKIKVTKSQTDIFNYIKEKLF